MKALRFHKFGGPENVVWENVPDISKPNSLEVTVKVHAGALNHLDIWVRKELPGIPVELPFIQGCDMAGEVVGIGNQVTDLKIGDRVALQPGYGCGVCSWCLKGKIHYCHSYGIYGETCDGNFAEYVNRPAENLFKIPDNLSWAQAASLPLVSLTSWEMLVEKARLKPGETLLVLGASSGLGSMAIQIGQLLQVKVIAVTSGDENVKRARDLGATCVIDRLVTPGFSKEVKKITDRQGADVVFEHTGAATFSESLRSLARGGRLVTCGGTTGPELKMDVRHLFSKQWQIFGSTMGSKGSLKEILPFFEKGLLKPVVDQEIPMEQGRDAQKLLEEGKIFGKIVLVN